MAKSNRIPCKLLVEGNDDLHVVANLCQAHDFPVHFRIIAEEGITKLVEGISAQLAESELEVMGILVDADTDIAARWQSLRKILIEEGYAVPPHPMPAGTILNQEDRPRVGIWLMPDNRLPGMLEDFAAALIPSSDPLLPYARQCVHDLPEQRFPAVQRAKADIHTWLAWQPEPGKPLGTAITAHYLNPEAPQAQNFIAWLQALFVV